MAVTPFSNSEHSCLLVDVSTCSGGVYHEHGYNVESRTPADPPQIPLVFIQSLKRTHFL